MSKTDLHKSNIPENMDFDEFLEQSIQLKQKNTLADDKFELLWNRAKSKQGNIRRMSWIITVSAAVFALMISFLIIKTTHHKQQELELQYQQATAALYKVSYYMNQNIDKLSPIDKMMNTTNYFEPLAKPIDGLEKLERVKRIPLKH